MLGTSIHYEVFKMLKAEGKITDVVIENMMNWRHSRFNVYCGNATWPHNEEGLENLACYVLRASFLHVTNVGVLPKMKKASSIAGKG